MHLKTLKLGSSISALIVPTAGFFRLPCKAPVVVQRADPIVNPGALAGHVHTVMGGNGFGFEMSYNATQTSTCSSCIVAKDMSNYWVPTLYYKAENGSFISVGQNGGMTIYYLQRKDSRDPGFAEGLQAFPPGFTMLAGDSNLRNFSDTPEQKAISYACLGTTIKETNGFPNIKCPGGLRSQVFFPSCWDGVSYEPKDQKLHLTYPSGVDSGSCSPPFNKRLISLFFEVVWKTPDFDKEWYGDSQPFVWSNGDPTGFGYHGDFFNGWDIAVLQNAIDTCNSDSGNIEDCPVLDLVTTKEAEACKIPVSVDEQVFGIMHTLPGCNPVQTGPDKATAKPGCGAPTSASSPHMPFADVTSSHKFEYVGCAPDIPGKLRTLLGGSITDMNGMTVERCIDHCKSQGFVVAGVEYSKECFCDNTIPHDRMPNPSKLVGNCNMPCTGNQNQNCGGAGLISLYQKCSNDKCLNAPVPFINGSADIDPVNIRKSSQVVSTKSKTPKGHTTAGNAAGVGTPFKADSADKVWSKNPGPASLLNRHNRRHIYH